MKTRIYVVKMEAVGQPEIHLVRAATRNSALRHVAEKLYQADVASQDELVKHTAAGVKVEDAGADA